MTAKTMTIAAMAREVEISLNVAYRAARQGRLWCDGRGTIHYEPIRKQAFVPKAWCYRCAVRPGRRNTKICDHCRAKLKAEGLFFCGGCLKALPIKRQAKDPRGRSWCRACTSAYNRRWYHESQGLAADPPPGFISTNELAVRLGIRLNSVGRRLRDGWLPEEHVWRRNKNRQTRWFVRDLPSYPEYRCSDAWRQQLAQRRLALRRKQEREEC